MKRLEELELQLLGAGYLDRHDPSVEQPVPECLLPSP